MFDSFNIYITGVIVYNTLFLSYTLYVKCRTKNIITDWIVCDNLTELILLLY